MINAAVEFSSSVMKLGLSSEYPSDDKLPCLLGRSTVSDVLMFCCCAVFLYFQTVEKNAKNVDLYSALS